MLLEYMIHSYHFAIQLNNIEKYAKATTDK